MTDKPFLATIPQLSRRHFVLGGLLAGASAVTYAAQPQVRYTKIDQRKFDSWIPVKVGPWTVQGSSGVLLPPPDATKDRLYDNVITRVYEAPDRPFVMFLIAYNNKQDGVVQLHRPEVCYPAGGYTISPTEPVSVRLPTGRDIPANIFSAVGPSRTEQVLYWTRLGQSFPRSWVDQRVAVMMANLHGEIPDGALVRVSSTDNDRGQALGDLRSFMEMFFDQAPQELQRVMTGRQQ